LSPSSSTAGAGTCTATNAPVGTDTVTGAYSGDTIYASSSGSTTLTVTSGPPPTTGQGFTPMSPPMRIADTRSGATDPSTYAGMTLSPGGQLTVTMPSSVPANATAVVAQLTAVNPSGDGYLSAFPAGSSSTGTANVLFTKGQTAVGNLVTVALGTGNAVTILNGAGGPAPGNTDFTLDLYGYYAPTSSSSGDPFTPVTPARVFDTRSGSGYPGAGSTLTGAGATVTIPIAGVGGVSSSAVAVDVNIAVTNTTATSYIECYPTGSPPSPSTPSVNQNWNKGETLSTQVVLGLSGGSITCMNAAGNVDLTADVDGYYTAPGTTGELFHPMTPTRVLDTRPAGVAVGSSTPLTITPSTAGAAVLNITDIASGGNYLTAYPAGAAVPTAANVNYFAGDPSSTLSNGAYVATSSGTIDIYDATSPANIVVDEFGYFA
jgi:hypothetical protein